MENNELIEFNSVVIDYEDGSQAIWVLSFQEIERVEHYLVTNFGQPDTLHA